MEKWIILNKLVILAYLVLQYCMGTVRDTALVILLLLVYISFNMGLHLCKKLILREILLVVSLVFLIGCAVYGNGLFILLLPINIYELISAHCFRLWISGAIAAIPMLFMKRTLLNPYALVGSFSLILYHLVSQTTRRIETLGRDNDALREKTHTLSEKLNKDSEYEQRIKYVSQLEERNKIAQEIHDQLGHALSGSLLQLEAARLYLEKDRERAGEMIQNVIGILRTGMDDIRVTLKNIKPASEQLGVNQVQLLLEEFGNKNHMLTSFLHLGDLERISAIQWKIIYDNIYEALTNIMKHAQATRVTVEIEVLNKFIKTEVKDNGNGASHIQKGIGILGMEERCGNVGGKMIVDGSDGFSIITLLPLKGE